MRFLLSFGLAIGIGLGILYATNQLPREFSDPKKVAEAHLLDELNLMLSRKASTHMMPPSVFMKQILSYSVVAGIEEKGHLTLFHLAKMNRGDRAFIFTVNFVLPLQNGNEVTQQERFLVLVRQNGKCESEWTLN